MVCRGQKTDPYLTRHESHCLCLLCVAFKPHAFKNGDDLLQQTLEHLLVSRNQEPIIRIKQYPDLAQHIALYLITGREPVYCDRSAQRLQKELSQHRVHQNVGQFWRQGPVLYHPMAGLERLAVIATRSTDQD